MWNFKLAKFDKQMWKKSDKNFETILWAKILKFNVMFFPWRGYDELGSFIYCRWERKFNLSEGNFVNIFQNNKYMYFQLGNVTYGNLFSWQIYIHTCKTTSEYSLQKLWWQKLKEKLKYTSIRYWFVLNYDDLS